MKTREEIKAGNDFLLEQLLKQEGFVVVFYPEMTLGDVFRDPEFPSSYPFRITSTATREDALRQVKLTWSLFPGNKALTDPPDVDYGWWKCVVAD